MHDVAVYLSSLPRIADRGRKVDVLTAFADGVRQCGGRVVLQTSYQVLDCKLAVILGWVGKTIKGPHIQLRKDIIERQQQLGRQVMSIDSSCFKFADPNSIFLRYSLGGVFYNKNNYANGNSNSQKWNEIQTTLGINMQPWRANGKHILVCLQRDGGWSMKGIDLNQWTIQTVTRLRQLTDRPILIRPHPKFQVNLHSVLSLPNVYQSTSGNTLQADLTDAWASVFYNSSSSVAAVLAGVPVFADDHDCVAWHVSNHDLINIEAPIMPDRTQWLYDLCACHWTDEESRSGAIYQKFLPFV
jgi:hypothetical protein